MIKKLLTSSFLLFLLAVAGIRASQAESIPSLSMNVVVFVIISIVLGFYVFDKRLMRIPSFNDYITKNGKKIWVAIHLGGLILLEGLCLTMMFTMDEHFRFLIVIAVLLAFGIFFLGKLLSKLHRGEI